MDTVRDPVYVDYDYYARHQLVQPTGEEKSLIERLLVTAEDIVHDFTHRRFLPIQATLADDIDADDTTLTLVDSGWPISSGSLVAIEDELIRLGSRVKLGDRNTFTVTVRGMGETTAAVHEADTAVYEVKGFRGNGRTTLNIGDFIQFNAIWAGMTSYSSVDTAYIIPVPTEWSRYTQLLYDGYWSYGVQYWISAVWGYGWETPEPVKQAVVRITEDMMERRATPGLSLVAYETVEGQAVRYRELGRMPMDAEQMLRPYRLIKL